MSELIISATGFTLQPLVDLRDGPCEIRWWYSRSFLDSDGVQVNWGSGTTGFWVTTPCSIADGLIVVDLDTTLWTTDNAQDPSPASIFLSAALYTARGKLIQQLIIANKAQWVVPSSLAPTTTWENFSAYNQAVFIANPPPVFYTAAQVDALLDRSFDEHPATDAELGTVLLTVPADIEASPVVWGANDPLVRDAIKIQGTDVDDTPPLDTQTIIYNQATNRAEWGNQNPGTGNVVSNEVTSVDGEITLFSGTGGKTIKRSPIVVSGGTFDAGGFVIGAGGFVGPLAGNVIGDVTGDLTGNVVGDVTGSVTGDLTGNVTGNVSGTASNLSGTPALPDGTSAATQAPSDNSTKLATTAYVDTAVGPGGGYTTVEDEGTPLTQRSTMNFVGAGVTAADSGGVTVVTIPGGGGSTDVLEVQVFS